MAKQTINIGSSANDGQGDPLRTAMDKINDNFDEIYTAGPVSSNIRIANSTITTTNTNGNLLLRGNGTGKIDVGAVGNLKITGGANGYVLTTDGTGNVAFNDVGNITFANLLATSGNITQDLVVGGNLTVNGTTTTINTATLDVEDKLVTIAYGAANSSVADGAGISIAGANANITYVNATNSFNFNKPAIFSGNIIPSANVTYSLGNVTNQWKDLYVSNNTIYINNIPLSLTSGNVLTVNGQAVLSNSSNASITTSGNVTATQFVGNIAAANVIGTVSSATVAATVTTAAQPNITSVGTLSSVTVTANVTGGNLLTGGLVSATGNITSAGNISGAYIVGNGSQLTGLPAQYGNANVVANLAALGSNPISTTGNVNAGNINANSGNVYTTNITLSGTGTAVNASQGNILTNRVTGTHFNFLSGIYTASLTGSGTLTANYTLSLPGNAGSSGQVLTTDGSGTLSWSIPAGTYGNANVVANLAALGSNPISTTGNITGGYILGNGSQLTGIIQSRIVNGTSNVNIANANGNATITANAVTWTFGNTGTTQFPNSVILAPVSQSITMQSDQYSQLMWENANLTVAPDTSVASNFYVAQNSATLDIVYRDGNSNQQQKSWLWSVDGTMTLPGGSRLRPLGANLDIFAVAGSYVQLINSDESSYMGVNGSGGYIVTAGGTWGFSTTGNLTAPGNVSAVGSITGGNLLTGGLISATGNVTSAGNISGAYILGNGSQLTGIAASYGNANVVANLAALGSNPISTTGNVTGGNILTGGLISATGNVTGGNLITAGVLSVTGNANIGNIGTTNIIGTSANVTITANAYVSTFDNTGNVTFANGTVSLTTLSATGNVTGAYILGNGSQLTGIAASYGNANVVANLAALGSNPISTTGNVTAGNIIGNISITGNVTGTSANVTLVAGAYSTVFDNTGNATFANGTVSLTTLSATGNVSGSNLNVTGNIVDTGALSIITGSNGNIALVPNGTGVVTVSSNLSVTGNISGNNLSLAGNITSNIGFTGATITINNAPGGNEGAEVIWALPSPANTVLSTNLVQDVFQNGMRFFESGGNSRGLYMDLGNVPNGAGTAVGYRDVPQVSFTGNATLAATDAGRHYYSTLATANTLTIANNTSVSWAVGTAITVVNRGSGNITVAQGSGVSLYLAGNSTAANRTVSTYGMATLLNVAANIWMINGTGVS